MSGMAAGSGLGMGRAGGGCVCRAQRLWVCVGVCLCCVGGRSQHRKCPWSGTDVMYHGQKAGRGRRALKHKRATGNSGHASAGAPPPSGLACPRMAAPRVQACHICMRVCCDRFWGQAVVLGKGDLCGGCPPHTLHVARHLCDEAGTATMYANIGRPQCTGASVKHCFIVRAAAVADSSASASFLLGALTGWKAVAHRRLITLIDHSIDKVTGRE